MKYLYDYCDMKNMFDKAIIKRSSESIFGESLHDIAEGIALEKNNGKYPEQWPWFSKDPS
jgi:hypothetical protein